MLRFFWFSKRGVLFWGGNISCIVMIGSPRCDMIPRISASVDMNKVRYDAPSCFRKNYFEGAHG